MPGGFVTRDKIKQVLARVEASPADVKAALVAMSGDVESAAYRLMTPEQRAREGERQHLAHAAGQAAGGGGGAMVVSMNSAALSAVLRYAPPLEVFTAAVHAGCALAQIEDEWNRFGDGSGQRTTTACFVSGPDGPDVERAAAFTTAALRQVGRKYVARDVERGRDVFEDGAGCLRCWPARVLLGEGIGDVLRIDRLTPCGFHEVEGLLPAEIAETAEARDLGAPTRVRHSLDFWPGASAPSATRVEAVFRTAEDRVVTVTLRDGVVGV